MGSSIPPETWDTLRSGPTESRVRAARFVLQEAGPLDAERIRSFERAESDEFVRRILRRAYLGCMADHAGSSPDVQGAVVDPERHGEREMAGIIIHELAPLVGRLEVSAFEEMESYQTSDTRLVIDDLRKLIESMDALRMASDMANIGEFDLTALVQEVVREVQVRRVSTASTRATMVELARDDHFTVRGDWGLLKIALANGLRNAVEACDEMVCHETACRVVMSWGLTDRDYWVSVIDEGPGLGPIGGSVFATGQTTKRAGGHIGYGLAAAQRAMEGLGGQATVTPRQPRGVRFEVRWPKGK